MFWFWEKLKPPIFIFASFLSLKLPHGIVVVSDCGAASCWCICWLGCHRDIVYNRSYVSSFICFVSVTVHCRRSPALLLLLLVFLDVGSLSEIATLWFFSLMFVMWYCSTSSIPVLFVLVKVYRFYPSILLITLIQIMMGFMFSQLNAVLDLIVD